MKFLMAIRVLALLGTTLLVSCGGGDSSVADSGGIGGTGITSVGSITGFGSIFVNGVEFETGSSSVSVDDAGGVESDLRVGMVVMVRGTLNDDGVTGTADSVAYDGNLEGPISDDPVPNLDRTETQFTVLGTPVIVSVNDTVFDGGIAFDTINKGDMVEVSGFYDENGILRATYIEKDSAGFVPGDTQVEARGTVTVLDEMNATFTLVTSSGRAGPVGSIQVTFGTAELSDLSSGTVADGLFVEVEGTLPVFDPDTIEATRIKSEDLGEDEGEIELEGIVTDFVDLLSDFKVAGIPVNASSAEFEPASLATSIGDGAMVEVEGELIGGVLQAWEVEGRGGDIEIESVVFDVTGTTVTLGPLGVNTETVSVSVDSQTRFEDEVLDLSPFTVADIRPGDFLKVEAFDDGSGNLVATRVKRDTADHFVLQGPVESAVAPDLTVLGVTFATNSGTQFETSDDDPITGTEFFDRVNVDDLVKIKDNIPSEGTADEVEFED